MNGHLDKNHHARAEKSRSIHNESALGQRSTTGSEQCGGISGTINRAERVFATCRETFERPNVPTNKATVTRPATHASCLAPTIARFATVSEDNLPALYFRAEERKGTSA
jgi:hypothetical protein